jgi:hypothetical protein
MINDHTNINDLTFALTAQPALPLKFYFDGVAINPGYHVTEVRHATINSLDCGRSLETERWEDVTIQLLDGSAQSTEGHMSSAKFAGIVSTATKALAVDDAHFLYFEFAPDNGPIRKLSVESIETGDQEISVSLGGEKAVCKPFQRSQAALATVASDGADTASVSSPGCCSTPAQSTGAACCS